MRRGRHVVAGVVHIRHVTVIVTAVLQRRNEKIVKDRKKSFLPLDPPFRQFSEISRSRTSLGSRVIENKNKNNSVFSLSCFLPLEENGSRIRFVRKNRRRVKIDSFDGMVVSRSIERKDLFSHSNSFGV